MNIAYKVRVLTPLAIGTGTSSLDADDAFPRGTDGMPFVPSTSVKGAVRARIQAALGPDDADAVFGTGGARPGRVYLSDLHIASGVTPVLDVVTRAALNERRSPRRGALAATEQLLPLDQDGAPLWLEGTMGLRPETAGASSRDLGAALVGLATLTVLGSRVHRGLGQVRVALEPRAKEHLDRVLRAGSR